MSGDLVMVGGGRFSWFHHMSSNPQTWHCGSIFKRWSKTIVKTHVCHAIMSLQKNSIIERHFSGLEVREHVKQNVAIHTGLFSKLLDWTKVLMW
jgi:hypothetical protein